MKVQHAWPAVVVVAVFGVVGVSRADSTECGAPGGCRTACSGNQDLCLPNAGEMRSQMDLPPEPPKELEETWEGGAVSAHSFDITRERAIASEDVRTELHEAAGNLCGARPSGVVKDLKFGYVIPGTYCHTFKVNEAWSTGAKVVGACYGSATAICYRKFPNPAHEEWRLARDAASKNNREFEAQQAKEKDCLANREATLRNCTAECERNCQAGNRQGGQGSQPLGGGPGGTGASGSEGAGQQNQDPQGGAGQQPESSGSSSNSSSSDDGSSSGGANLGALADAASSSSGSSDAPKAIAALGAIGGAGAAVGAGASTDSQGPNAAAQLAAYKAEIRGGKNVWQPAVISLGLATAGFLSLLFVDLISETYGVTHPAASDALGPTALHSWSWLFGVDGPTCWWARFDFQFQLGYHSFDYQGAFLGWGNDSRGLPIHAPIEGHYVGGIARWGLVRASASYLGAYGSVLTEAMKARAAQLPEGTDFFYSESQVFSGFEYSVGLQVYQGLFSPYLDYRFTSLRPQHAVSVAGSVGNAGGFLYLPWSGTLVVGNSFNFSGVFASKGPLRRSLVLDVSAPLGKGGVVTSGLRVGAGYTVSFF